MRLVISVIALAFGASLASADVNIYDETIGYGEVEQQYFNQSNLNDLHSPNSTNSVKFTFGREEWTWRVNVTSLSVPDARLGLDSAKGPPLPDPRVTVTTYDLQWPNASATLNETAIRLDEQFGAGGQITGNNSTYDPMCISVAVSPLWPNVTNKLRDNKDGDCEAVLGKECVAALLSSLRLGSSSCNNPNTNIDACQGFFNDGYYQSTAWAISEPHSGDDGPNFNASIEEQTHVSDGIWWGSGFASAEPNSTALRQGESQLRIMFLSLPNSKAAVCTRVDPSIDDADVSPIAQRADWDGGKSSKSGNGGGDDDSSAASPRVAATVGSVGVVGLVAAVFGLL